MDRNSGIQVAHARDRSMQPRSDLRVIVRCRLTARSRRKWTNCAGLRRQTEIDIEAKRAQEVARAQEKAESVPTEKTIETLERWKNHHGTLSEKAEGASFEAHARVEAVLHDACEN